MKVLIACEESQRVCMAFRELGHEAYSCDIQDCSGGHPEWHIKDDALKYINGRCSFITCDGKAHEISGKWDLLIAHPPCTYLSNAGACRLYPKKGQLNQERYQKGLEAKEFFMMFYNADCDKIAVENPIPSKIFCLPKYTQTIQPYQYGHPYSKKTCLWLKNLPPLKPTEIISDYTPYLPSGTGRKLKGKSYGAKEQNRNRKVMRSKTFPGIARAMAEQWGGQA
ncbi:MAG: DNA cytosine methyltransferase [Oscillospiraceae bacterium]|nr:DNA cytosine methyltransferase [Oscillospiraceae bacterium]